MARYRSLICDDEERRKTIAAHDTIHGIDYVEIVTTPAALNQRVINIYFIAKTTTAGATHLANMLASLDDAVESVSIVGGVRIPAVQVEAVKHVVDHIEVTVKQPGDFSIYTLTIQHPQLDPVYAQCDLNFKVACPSRFDCRQKEICPEEPRREPQIDYMAKDYASFRQALIDLIPTLAPQWKERHEADLGIAMVELLSYVGDHLSYYQDAVANEAFLETARQRISTRRHTRLIDYQMHDGASAQAFVFFKVDSSGTLKAKSRVLARIDIPLGSKSPPHGAIIPVADWNQALKTTTAIFETVHDVQLTPKLNEIKIHPWGNRQCCLPKGVTSVDLVGGLSTDLKVGDFILFEEVIGPETGLKQDADPSHRQVVRLTQVLVTEDPLEPDPITGSPPLKITRVSWARADALTFPICISAKLNDGSSYIENVSLARGNIALVDHGSGIEEWFPGNPADPRVAGIKLGKRSFRFSLKEGPLSQRIPDSNGKNGNLAVAEMQKVDPRRAMPQVSIQIQTGTSTILIPQPLPDLLDSGPFELHFTVETDNKGRALIRFGDGAYGQTPPNGAHIKAKYRVGVGSAGHVGRESLIHVLPSNQATPVPTIKEVRNPLSAWGGIDPQPIEQVKQLAPAAFRADQYRAVTEVDYARVAEKHPAVSKAVTTFRWTGSWHTVFIAVDPVGRTDIPATLRQQLLKWVRRFKQAGYDLEIDEPIYVPLEIEIDVCVDRRHFRGDVEVEVLAALSNKDLPGGKRGFFHPDLLTFGEPIYLSQLYAVIEAVEGVDSAEVVKFQKFGKVANYEIEQGYIPMSRLEIARLDNDPSLPENGSLQLNMKGGK
ncbi:MAG: putative baseplate assembly protein [Anaerolineales bacterium]|nr:putative baseplate assembly protein [Anaerolineales bacterium]